MCKEGVDFLATSTDVEREGEEVADLSDKMSRIAFSWKRLSRISFFLFILQFVICVSGLAVTDQPLSKIYTKIVLYGFCFLSLCRLVAIFIFLG